MEIKGFRNKKQKLKTARGRSTSSQKWLERHLNDPYVNMARQKDYRSRSAFKLIQIDERFKILHKAKVIVDLGCAPGGWLQVSTEKAKNARQIMGIDLQDVAPIPGATIIKGDIYSDEVIAQLQSMLCGAKVDLLLSDMAAAASGHPETDHLRIISLIEAALGFAFENLAPGGSFISKFLRGVEEKSLMDNLRPKFSKIRQFKPDSSYADSAEVFLICEGFKAISR
jgi:23S rRNA (uridine2552-2'-O)-methyltransferase